MKIAVYGAVAIGGYLACELARSGVDVTVIARGRTLAAIRAMPPYPWQAEPFCLYY